MGLRRTPLEPFRRIASSSSRHAQQRPWTPLRRRHQSQTDTSLPPLPAAAGSSSSVKAEHAVISTFDLFSIGIGPSSSHTVGPMRASKIFMHSLPSHLHEHIHSLKISLHGSLAATGLGHMTPHAVLLGLTGDDPETVQVGRLSVILDEVKAVEEIEVELSTGQRRRVKLDPIRDLTWHLNPLPAHPNGLRFSVFDEQGDLLATNEYFSVGGGFVVNSETQIAENLYYKAVDPSQVPSSRREQVHGQNTAAPGGLPSPLDSSDEPIESAIAGSERQPPYLFDTAASLLAICEEHNLSIAQVVWENELAFRTPAQIRHALEKIWHTMDMSIRNGVTSTEPLLPGGLKVKRRAPGLYRRLQKGFYASPGPASRVSPQEMSGTDKERGIAVRGKRTGRMTHEVGLIPPRSTPVFPGIEYLSCMAIAVNEINASGGRVVTAPTNGAAGVIPATLKYVTEFLSQDPERDTMVFLLTASAVGMLFKRGATISAAEGGCMAEVGVACSMAAAGIAACLGAEPAVILQAAEIGIEHNLGLTCDPLGGLVQIPCIERNSLGAVKAVTAAQLAMAGDGEHTVSLDDAIEACRTTALDMHSHYKETSLAGLATTVKIPLSSPAC